MKCIELEIFTPGECVFHHESYGEKFYYNFSGEAIIYVKKDSATVENEMQAIKEKINKIENDPNKQNNQGYFDEDKFDLFYEKYQKKVLNCKGLRKSLYDLYKASADNKFLFDNLEHFEVIFNIDD